jgi:hypothetical protein
LQENFILSLAFVALENFLGAYLRLFDIVVVAIHVRVLLGAGVPHCGPHRHDALHEMEVFGGDLVLVREVFGVIDELGSAG